MTQITETSAARRPPLRRRAWIALVAAAFAGILGAGFAPMWQRPAGVHWPHFWDVAMVRVAGWNLLALPALLLVAAVVEARRAGLTRWVPLLVGALMTVVAVGWTVHIHWYTFRMDARGEWSEEVTLHAGPGLMLYGLCGLVALVLGVLIIVAPRRMRRSSAELST